MRLIMECVSHLWWTAYNSRPKSHSGSGGMGPGTEEEGAIKTTWKSTHTGKQEEGVSGFTFRFRKRNLSSARSCETLLVSVTFSIPSVPLFRRGLVQPHSTDTSRRLSSSPSTQGSHIQSPHHFILNKYALPLSYGSSAKH